MCLLCIYSVHKQLSPQCVHSFYTFMTSICPMWRMREVNLPGIALLVSEKSSGLSSVYWRDTTFDGLERSRSTYHGAHAVGAGQEEVGGHRPGCHAVQDVFIESTNIYSVLTTCQALFQVLCGENCSEIFFAFQSSCASGTWLSRGSDADSGVRSYPQTFSCSAVTYSL